MSLIRFVDFGFQYAGQSSEQPTLKQINLSIRAGECVLLTGRSGSGKSTIIRAINGLVPNFYQGTSTGYVTLDNTDISQMNEKSLYRKVTTVYQNPRSQFFTDTIGSELVFSSENFGFDVDTIEQLLNYTLAHFDLIDREREKLEQLSSGEKQRVACAASCLIKPKVILLDEPSANLDAKATTMLARTIELWKAQGVTVVIAEHRSFYLSGLVDREVHIERGQIVGETSHQVKPPLSLRKARTLTSKHSSINGTPDSYWVIAPRKSFWSKNESRMVNKRIAKGSVVAVVGENGAGKTTLFRQLCALQKGSFQLLDDNGVISSKALRERCFYVDQEVNRQLLCDSVLEEVLLNMPNHDENAALKILRELNLEHLEQGHPLTLSGGQKQRLALATAIAANRDFTVLDEPTSGLDQANVLRVIQQIEKLRKNGKTVIVISHDPDLVLNCCDCVLFIRNHVVEQFYSLDNPGKHKMEQFLRFG